MKPANNFMKTPIVDEQANMFSRELDRTIDRFRDEFDLSYAAVVGVLLFKIHTIQHELDEEDE